jgi:non-specific serine/threonine protein kinase
MDNGQKTADSLLVRYRFGTAEFDPARFELRVGGLPTELERRPLEVLALLLRHADEPVTKEELLEAVWGSASAPEAPLHQAVQKLRRALGEENARLIHAPSRIGYRLEGPVTRLPAAWPDPPVPEFRTGMPVPGRPGWVLDRRLADGPATQTWVALHARTEVSRVFKFGTKREDLSALRHEAAIGRHLREALGEREDLARLLDWNFEHIPCFLEYEYGGQNLVEWSAAEDRLAGLDTEARVALFLQVVEAVAFVHAAGVVHKDLRPAHILLSRRSDGWQVRLAGFGYNRLLDPGRLVERTPAPTETDVLAPASPEPPLYLAPELITGRAPTVQSDVYALGLVLYQLLAGDFGKSMGPGWEADIADDMLREDILQATDGSPMRRFANVGELARRLRRREERRAERARDRAAAVQARDAARAIERTRVRRPVVIGVIAALTVGILVVLWLYHRVDVARRETDDAVARAQTVNRFLADDVLAASEPAAPGAVNDPMMRDVLARGDARVERFSGDPITLALLQSTLGRAWSALAEHAAAVEHHRRAVKLLTDARGAEDPATLDARYQLADALGVAGSTDEAMHALTATDQAAGAQLAQASPLALQARWTRASLLRLQQRNDAALEALQAADTLRQAIAPQDDVWAIRILDALSDTLFRLGRAGDAAEALEPLLAQSRTPERLGPVRWATLRLFYASILKSLGRLDEAETFTRAALAQLEKSNGPDDYFVGVALNQLADVQGLRGRWGDALEPSKRADAIVRARLGESSQTAWLSRVNLGVIELQVGQFAQAADDLRQGHDGLAGLLGDQSPPAQGAAFYLASALSELGHQEEAWNLADALDPAALASSVMGGGWTPRLSALKGQIRLRQGRRADGLALLEPAVQEMEKSGLAAWILEPYRKALAQAKAGP